MTNPDFRALCVELTDCLEKADWPHRYKAVFQQWMDIARAALAEPDGPAVSDDREPPSVDDLRQARRPKPPSLADQGLAVLDDASDRLDAAHENVLRRALERLQELEGNG